MMKRKVVRGSEASLKVTVQFFASFRELFRHKEKEFELGAHADVQELLDLVCYTPRLRKEIFEEGSLRSHITILKNGRHIQHLNGLGTELADGDIASIFPPIAGG